MARESARVAQARQRAYMAAQIDRWRSRAINIQRDAHMIYAEARDLMMLACVSDGWQRNLYLGQAIEAQKVAAGTADFARRWAYYYENVR